MNTEKQEIREEVQEGGNGNMETMKWNNSKEQEYRPLSMEEALSALVDTLDEPERRGSRAGLPLRDVLFGLIYKVGYQRSYRRAVSELRQAARGGLITIGTVPAESTLRRYMSDPRVTPVLQRLVVTSSWPLTAVESGHDQDSVVFAASPHSRPEGSSNSLSGIRLHMLVGESTGVIRAVDVAGEGRVPRKNSHSVSVPEGAMWRTLSNGYDKNWKEYYASRRVIESAVANMKRRYGDRVRSKSDVGRVNELYCGIIAHNLTVLVYEMFHRKGGPVECDLGGSNGRPAGS